MLKQLEVFMIIALFILLTAIILIVHTTQRVQEFKQHNLHIQKTIVHGTADAIDLKLQDKQRQIRLFLSEYAPLLNRLTQQPDDENTANDIRKRLENRFPDFFTYTLSNAAGMPLLSDLDSLVGEVCQQDLKSFAQFIQKGRRNLQNDVFIHPRDRHYHYDVMIPVLTNASDTNIFFISFHLRDIATSLKTHETPGQQLILVKKSEPDLIEVTQKGARDKLSRDYRLNKQELSRIRASEDIPHTNWRLVSLPEANFERGYLRKLWQEAFIILCLATFALIILLMILFTVAKKRKA